MTVLLAYMAMYHFCAWCLWRSGKNIRSLRTGLAKDQSTYLLNPHRNFYEDFNQRIVKKKKSSHILLSLKPRRVSSLQILCLT